MNVRPEFKVHKLNAKGAQVAHAIAQAFSELLDKIEAHVPPGRSLALVKTDLERACFNAKRGMAELPENQE